MIRLRKQNNTRISNTHLLIAQIQELVQLNSTVRERAEGSLLLEISGDLGIGNRGISLLTSSSKSVATPPLPLGMLRNSSLQLASRLMMSASRSLFLRSRARISIV
jgi:hypothetical protein